MRGVKNRGGGETFPSGLDKGNAMFFFECGGRIDNSGWPVYNQHPIK